MAPKLRAARPPRLDSFSKLLKLANGPQDQRAGLLVVDGEPRVMVEDLGVDSDLMRLGDPDDGGERLYLHISVIDDHEAGHWHVQARKRGDDAQVNLGQRQHG